MVLALAGAFVKILLEHTQGVLKGEIQIVGDTNQLLTDEQTLADLPTLQAFTRAPGLGQMETIEASLVAVKRSYVLYRELIEPALGNKNFSPAQR
jgi:hypothetical protein